MGKFDQSFDTNGNDFFYSDTEFNVVFENTPNHKTNLKRIDSEVYLNQQNKLLNDDDSFDIPLSSNDIPIQQTTTTTTTPSTSKSKHLRFQNIRKNQDLINDGDFVSSTPADLNHLSRGNVKLKSKQFEQSDNSYKLKNLSIVDDEDEDEDEDEDDTDSPSIRKRGDVIHRKKGEKSPQGYEVDEALIQSEQLREENIELKDKLEQKNKNYDILFEKFQSLIKENSRLIVEKTNSKEIIGKFENELKEKNQELFDLKSSNDELKRLNHELTISVDNVREQSKVEKDNIINEYQKKLESSAKNSSIDFENFKKELSLKDQKIKELNDENLKSKQKIETLSDENSHLLLKICKPGELRMPSSKDNLYIDLKLDEVDKLSYVELSNKIKTIMLLFCVRYESLEPLLKFIGKTRYFYQNFLEVLHRRLFNNQRLADHIKIKGNLTTFDDENIKDFKICMAGVYDELDLLIDAKDSKSL
ncbi:hypothetical protein CANARDRAFT_174041 [[Candida] arabinofermentans NRRL YB-2248]|uniref:Uncharacterized protein n=1 Tax=[Candida] arabinofermentans NRRL YB-2248 TaxID=983967 RepID=A0A1E4T8Y8_9ASCO|nr:hypothetical protein CANARDRAFT_174041 [[Candida] arabinofermentans NRRL YB-2248]